MDLNYQIENMTEEDWDKVSDIYAEGIKTGTATFQHDIPKWSEWDAGHCKSCRLVVRDKDIVVGWAALSSVSGRHVYSGVAEVSIYILPAYQSKGIGHKLLTALVNEADENGYWTLQASIIRGNKKSIKLHESCGFRIVGYRERLGQMQDGKWHDVILAEKRSTKNGLLMGSEL